MSHPVNYVENSQEFQSAISRCCHGVFRPDYCAADKPNPVCSVCTLPRFDKRISYAQLKIVNAEIPIEEEHLTVVQSPIIEDEEDQTEDDLKELGESENPVEATFDEVEAD